MASTMSRSTNPTRPRLSKVSKYPLWEYKGVQPISLSTILDSGAAPPQKLEYPYPNKGFFKIIVTTIPHSSVRPVRSDERPSIRNRDSPPTKITEAKDTARTTVGIKRASGTLTRALSTVNARMINKVKKTATREVADFDKISKTRYAPSHMPFAIFAGMPVAGRKYSTKIARAILPPITFL